ncbi:MAG: hypothetical protein JW910_14885 [Anaerolineae bacterium]|nr:hypothetical protein [Anaerolineae bacterium]
MKRSRRWLGRALALVVFLLVVCAGVVLWWESLFNWQGPYTLAEAAEANLPLPFHYPDPDSAYGSLDVAYRYMDWGDELELVTTFLAPNATGAVVRVAELRTAPLGGPPGDDLRDIVTITWAREGRGRACGVHLMASENPVAEPAFTACVWFWADTDRLDYTLYTIWTTEETVNLANALIRYEEAE